MELKKQDGVSYLEHDHGGFRVICTTRTGGYSPPPYDSLNLATKSDDDQKSVEKNYEKIFALFKLTRERLVQLNQVHGDDVLVIKEGDDQRIMTGDYDAVVTDDGELALSIMTADCVPIFLYDNNRGAFAAVHAGWRGTARGIAEKVVAAMAREFMCDINDIHAVIGPSIGGCCYEVEAEVINSLTDSLLDGEGSIHSVLSGKAHVDLQKYNVAQLVGCGIDARNITGSKNCTSCDSALFFSYRRERDTGRHLSLIKKSE